MNVKHKFTINYMSVIFSYMIYSVCVRARACVCVSEYETTSGNFPKKKKKRFFFSLSLNSNLFLINFFF